MSCWTGSLHSCAAATQSYKHAPAPETAWHMLHLGRPGTLAGSRLVLAANKTVDQRLQTQVLIHLQLL